MPGGKSCRLIKKKQLGISVGLHDRAVPVLVHENTSDPVRVTPARPAEALIAIMQDPTIAHEQPTCWIGHDLTMGGDTIL